jgi:iduronate 2-sulfatase
VEAKRNVLHFIIDDLRPQLPPYEGDLFYPGNLSNRIGAPAIAQLAEKSTVFMRAYAQYPLCSPSRASFFTGRRPSVTGVSKNDEQDFRDTHPNMTTIPQQFKQNGYAALGTGKVFHPLAGTRGSPLIH